MKVKRLYIIKIGTGWEGVDGEITGMANGLYAKYVTQRSMAGHACMLSVTFNSGFQEGESENRIETDISFDQALTQEAETDIGVYICAHSNSAEQTSGGLSAVELATLLGKDLSIPSIRKLCLVSCGLAKTVSNRSFLQDLCKSLADYNLTPMIAGWDQFVTVAFEGMTKFIPHQTANTKVAVSAQNAGKKIMQGLQGAQTQGGHGGLSGKDVLIHVEGKTTQAAKLLEHKFVWQIVNGNPVPVTTGWSDKDERRRLATAECGRQSREADTFSLVPS